MATSKKKTTTKKTTTKKAGTAAQRAITEPLAAATADLKRQWQRREKEILALRAQGASAFDELYETVHEVLSAEPPLYLGGGMRSEREFIQKLLPGESERTVKRNVLVAICFTPEDEGKKGIAFLEQVAKYEQERTGSTTLPRALDLSRLKIEVREGSKRIKKPALDCTPVELDAARAALGKKTVRKAKPEEAAITKALPKRKAFGTVKVRVSDGRAAFTGVPLGELAAFGKALAGAKLPAN